jgi:hypothetical protein
MLAKSRHPGSHPESAAIRSMAKAFSILGWIGFWAQMVMVFIAGIALLFTASGLSPNPSPGTSLGIFWAVWGIMLLVIAIVFDFQYVRISKGLLREPGALLHPKRAETARLLRIGALIGFAGMLLSLVGSGASVIVLVAKTVSQPPGVAIVDPNRIVRALDVFVVLANLTLIAAHLIGTVIPFWLLDRVHHYPLHPAHHYPQELGEAHYTD